MKEKLFCLVLMVLISVSCKIDSLQKNKESRSIPIWSTSYTTWSSYQGLRTLEFVEKIQEKDDNFKINIKLSFAGEKFSPEYFLKLETKEVRKDTSAIVVYVSYGKKNKNIDKIEVFFQKKPSIVMLPVRFIPEAISYQYVDMNGYGSNIYRKIKRNSLEHRKTVKN